MLQLCRYADPDTGVCFGAVVDGTVYNLQATERPALQSFDAWLQCVTEQGLDAAMEELEQAVDVRYATHQWVDLQNAPCPGTVHLLPPLDLQEVWAAGVTYLRSRDAREDESDRLGIYDKVYMAERPEIFFKATPHRVVGTHDSIYIRSDARWNVPEPELTVVLSSDLQVVGYTVGNDVSSRDIEGANPLYLPQAKIYSRSCALGPAITVARDFESGEVAAIEMQICREGEIVFEGAIDIGQMKRTIEELVAYLGRNNTFPHGVFLMTGTGLVPPDDYTLDEGDVVEICIDRIGCLVNEVVRSRGTTA